MTRLSHPSPRDDPAGFAQAFLSSLNEQLPKWFGRSGIEVKETHLVERFDDYAVEIVFRWDKAPEALYGFRWGNICRTAAQDVAGAEAAGSETVDALGPSVTMALANLDEMIHGSRGPRGGLPRSRVAGEILWL